MGRRRGGRNDRDRVLKSRSAFIKELLKIRKPAGCRQGVEILRPRAVEQEEDGVNIRDRFLWPGRRRKERGVFEGAGVAAPRKEDPTKNNPRAHGQPPSSMLKKMLPKV
jgi:hypothetical protein